MKMTEEQKNKIKKELMKNGAIELKKEKKFEGSIGKKGLKILEIRT